MIKFVRIIGFLLALLVLVPAVFAQTGGQETSSSQGSATPITADTPVKLALSGTTPVELSYEAMDAETVTITARSLEPEGVIDPVLTLYDSSGAVIASNDDHENPSADLTLYDAQIAGAELPAVGTYLIAVAANSAVQQGKVEVTLTTGNADQPPPSITSGRPAQTISDTLPDNGTYTTTFDASQGMAVTITVRATDNQLDPKVTLLDPSGAEVASNDDHDAPDDTLSTLDSQIADFVIPSEGTYTIQITGFAGIGGTFELTIQLNGGASVVLPDQPTATPADDTQVINDSINPNGTYAAPLDANAGDVYTITVVATSADFDPRVVVYLNDTYIIDNDDYGTNDPALQQTDSRIYDWIVTEAGSYEIDVRGYKDSAGSFTLTIDKVATGAPTGLPSEQVALGTVKSRETFTQKFEAQAGDYVTITARALTTDFDPYVALVDAAGTVLIDNDNHGTSSSRLGFYDAWISNYHIPADGTYTVEVSGSTDVAGSFGLTIGTLR